MDLYHIYCLIKYKYADDIDKRNAQDTVEMETANSSDILVPIHQDV
jgi:hypothetical protein